MIYYIVFKVCVNFLTKMSVDEPSELSEVVSSKLRDENSGHDNPIFTSDEENYKQNTTSNSPKIVSKAYHCASRRFDKIYKLK